MQFIPKTAEERFIGYNNYLVRNALLNGEPDYTLPIRHVAKMTHMSPQMACHLRRKYEKNGSLIMTEDACCHKHRARRYVAQLIGIDVTLKEEPPVYHVNGVKYDNAPR